MSSSSTDAGADPPADEAHREGGPWPALPLAEWSDTCRTLHMWTQIVGKTRLALAPPVNHWWHVPLYVTARGLGTTRIPYGRGGFEVEFDFLAHELRIDRDDGRRWSTTLGPRSVADFWGDYTSGLHSLGIEVRLRPHPVEVVEAIPFPEDHGHASYDARWAHRFWRALSLADRALSRFRGSFLGKCSPVHFFWGSFDLACTRFSGRAAPPHPGGIPNLADWVTREAYSHECISAGWWPGSPDGPVREPAFYAYAYPQLEGAAKAPLRPEGARYDATLGEWLLPWDSVRAAVDPEREVLAFLESTYAAAADLAGWPRDELERPG